jgi:hypothetical protein
MAQKRRFERQQKELEKVKMDKKNDTVKMELLARIDVLESFIEELDLVAEAALTFYELSRLEKARKHLVEALSKVNFDYTVEMGKIEDREEFIKK